MPNTARDELYIANPEASSSVVTQVTQMGNRQPGVLELLTQWESTGWGVWKPLVKRPPPPDKHMEKVNSWKWVYNFLPQEGWLLKKVAFILD